MRVRPLLSRKEADAMLQMLTVGEQNVVAGEKESDKIIKLSGKAREKLVAAIKAYDEAEAKKAAKVQATPQPVTTSAANLPPQGT